MSLLPPTEQRLYGGVRILDYPCLANVRRLDLGALTMVYEYHRHGITIDAAHFAALDARLKEKIAGLNARIGEMIGYDINPDSGDQVAHLLFDQLGLHKKSKVEIKLTNSRKRMRVNDESIAALREHHPVVDLLVGSRQASKLRNTYTTKLPGMVSPLDGRLHTWFKHTRAATGRLASEDPNLQNIPTRTEDGVEIRRGFVAGKDQLGRQCVLASIDLSQIEMVLAGYLSQDAMLLKAFREGLDIHTMTAIAAFKLQSEGDKWMSLAAKAKAEEDTGDGGWIGTEKAEWKAFKSKKRLPAKTIGFGVLYGQTAMGAQYNIMAQGGPYIPLEEVVSIISGWFGLYSGVSDWMDLQHSRVRRYGMNWTFMGRIRRITEALSTIKRVKASGYRQAGNSPIQGSAQDMIKLDMWQLMELVRYYQTFGTERCWPLLQIHDELIFELSPNIAQDFCAEAKEIMTTNVKLSVPVGASASTALTWGDLK